MTLIYMTEIGYNFLKKDLDKYKDLKILHYI